MDGTGSCSCRGPVFNGLTRPESTGKGGGGEGSSKAKRLGGDTRGQDVQQIHALCSGFWRACRCGSPQILKGS